MNINIPSSYIRHFVLSRYEQKGRICSSGREFVMESIFVDNDKKRHMSVNLETGLWQCFKSSRSGNFVSLYCETEKLKYFQGYKKLLKESIFTEQENVTFVEKEPKFDIPKSFRPISLLSYSSHDEEELKAWKYLYDRHVLTESNSIKFYISNDPSLKDRVVLPYEKDDLLYFYEARAIKNGMNPKYLAPKQNEFKKSEVLYPYDEDADSLVVCEGVFDAISLKLNGVNATSTGTAYVSKIQNEILRFFPGKIIMGYNGDTAGEKGLNKFFDLCRRTKMLDLHVCVPPPEFKDWNEAYIKGLDVKDYISKNTRKYDTMYMLERQASSL